ncbi:FAST kinase domain-containing protein 5, mitochondrial [Oncorhynchus masou masou]|uniref:FAST kinase domain-containing protein 5, mitochondrial n=1 Tax=Oncorhynchus masou masou TaxID=90313 RepID=UPI0031840174
MSVGSLCHVARLRHLSLALHRQFLRARHLHNAYGEPETEGLDEEDGGEGVHPGGYRLQYNPSSYYRPQHDPGASLSRLEMEEQCQSTVTSAFRQQSNRYSVSSSRRLSSTKNTLLDLAFNRGTGAKAERAPPYRTESLTPDVKGDPRAFQTCRPEYSAMTLDLSQRPAPVHSKQAFFLLHKVTILKGSMEPVDVTGFLTKLSHLHPDQTPLVRGDTRFIMLLRYSVENLSHFSHSQLLKVLRSFVWLGLPPTHSMLGLYEAELGRRAGEMGLHQLLLAADLWRCLGRSVPQYLQCLYDCASLHLGQVGVPEIVQLLYVMGEGRHCPKELVHPLEQILMRHLDQLEPEEVGAVCLGLFKSQTALSEGSVNRLVDRAHSVVYEMSDFAMVNVMKLLRFSYLDHRAWLEVMAHEVPRRAPSMGVQGLMHVALACSSLHYRNERILLAVAERLPSLAPHCRSKDSGKLIWAFGTLGVLPSQCPNFYPSLIEALRQREDEFQRYPEHLLTGLLGLAFICQLPEDLVALALSPEFVTLATRSKQLDLKKDLFTLDGTVALELPHWTGPRLSRELREETTEILWRFAQKDVCQKVEVLEAEAVLRDLLGGEEFVSKRMILPHTRSIDLEVHLNPVGQPLPVTSVQTYPITSQDWTISSGSSTQGWEKINTGVTLTEDLLTQLTNGRKTPLPPTKASQLPLLRRTEPDEGGGLFSVGVDLTDGLVGTLTKRNNPGPLPRDSHKAFIAPIRLAIQVTNRNHYCYRSPQLLGLHAMKRRQLKLTGYRVVELPHREWFPLLRRTHAEKLAYMHCKVYGTLD